MQPAPLGKVAKKQQHDQLSRQNFTDKTLNCVHERFYLVGYTGDINDIVRAVVCVYLAKVRHDNLKANEAVQRE